jgi:hypothetical protein
MLNPHPVVTCTTALTSALWTGFYTHAGGQRELVRVVTEHAAGEGGGFTIFIPSLGRERNTVPDKLEIVGGGAEDVDATAAAENDAAESACM